MAITDKAKLILLPGMDGTGVLLDALRARLSPIFDATIISYPQNEPLGYKELTDLVLEQLPDAPYVILGESFSGPVAINISLRDRERTAGLILAASFVRHPLPSFLSSFAAFLNPKLVPKAIIEYTLMRPNYSTYTSMLLKRALNQLPAQVFRKRLREVLTVDKRNCLRKVNCPVLYIQGRKDRIMGDRQAHEVEAEVSDFQYRSLDAPHMMLETHPTESAAVIAKFSKECFDYLDNL